MKKDTPSKPIPRSPKQPQDSKGTPAAKAVALEQNEKTATGKKRRFQQITDSNTGEVTERLKIDLGKLKSKKMVKVAPKSPPQQVFSDVDDLIDKDVAKESKTKEDIEMQVNINGNEAECQIQDDKAYIPVSDSDNVKEHNTGDSSLDVLLKMADVLLYNQVSINPETDEMLYTPKIKEEDK